MASIAQAAMKDGMERRLSDQVRLRTGFMLTFEELASRDGVVEKHVLHRVLQRRLVSNTQLLALPLSLAYFLFYVTAYYMHEDINNVYFLESTIRMRADNLFLEAQTIDGLWDQLTGPFVDTFFVQVGSDGKPLPRSTSESREADLLGQPRLYDNWGLWGRVETYNQIQGAMRFASRRATEEEYGGPRVCFGNVTCELCRTNAGFQAGTGNYQCKEVSMDAAPAAGSPRRLELYRPELEGTMQEGVDKSPFTFYLYPGDNVSTIKEVLQYYKAREWIDHRTEFLEIAFYLVNCELGRCRLEQVHLTFRFSPGGGIYYKRKLTPIFLDLFSGPRNTLADLCFVGVWILTFCFRFSLAWRAFLQSELFNHLMDVLNIFECIVVICGMLVIVVVGFFWFIAERSKELLKPIRALGWDLNSENPHPDEIGAMFEQLPPWADRLELIRNVGNFFALVLMFRFFINFGAQPRLRVVTTTLAVVMNDLFHFGLVFIPIIVAYMVSGTIMWGRSFSTFTTVKAAIGSSFRIMMEAEYDWQDWTREFYWYTGLWAWTFMFMVVLLMLNMVLAIILDVYNEVRIKTGAKDAEPMWTTGYNVFQRCFHMRNWVPDRRLLKTLTKANQVQGSVVTEVDMRNLFPNIPKAQIKILFGDCRREMMAHSTRDLDNRSLLQAAGSLMQNLDKSMLLTRRLNDDEALDPIHTWTTPLTKKTPAAAANPNSHDTFLTVLSHSKGTKNPHVVDPDAPAAIDPDAFGFASETSQLNVPPAPANAPPWLKEVQELLSSQRQWLSHAQWQLQQMEWQIQLGHACRYKSTFSTTDAPAL